MRVSQATSFYDFNNRNMYGYFAGFRFVIVEKYIELNFVEFQKKLSDKQTYYQGRSFQIGAGAEEYLGFVSKISTKHFENSRIWLGENLKWSRAVIDNLAACINNRRDKVIFSITNCVSLELCEYLLQSITATDKHMVQLTGNESSEIRKHWFLPIITSSKFGGISFHTIANNISQSLYSSFSYCIKIRLDYCPFKQSEIVCLLRNSNPNQELIINYGLLSREFFKEDMREAFYFRYTGILTIRLDHVVDLSVFRILEGRSHPTKLLSGWRKEKFINENRDKCRLLHGKLNSDQFDQ